LGPEASVVRLVDQRAPCRGRQSRRGRTCNPRLRLGLIPDASVLRLVDQADAVPRPAKPARQT